MAWNEPGGNRNDNDPWGTGGGRGGNDQGPPDLDEALKGLTDGERFCVSLCYGAGLSHAEAAEALNLPLGTVKSHVKRGLDKLRQILNPEAGETGRESHVG